MQYRDVVIHTNAGIFSREQESRSLRLCSGGYRRYRSHSRWWPGETREASVGELDHGYSGSSALPKLRDNFGVAREIKDLKLLRNPDKRFDGRGYPAGISIHQYVRIGSGR